MSARSGNHGGTGASRRDVLRGGAVGVGALVGAMALVNADEVSAEAKAALHFLQRVTFNGINDNNHPVDLQSFTIGGDVNGSAEVVPAKLVLDATKYSPLLLQAYADATTVSPIVIKRYEPDLAGKQKLTYTITLASARIISCHTDIVTSYGGSPHYRDILQVVFGAATFLRNDSNTTYTWTLPT